MPEKKAKRKIFYGWWIVLASSIGHFLSGGFYFYGFSTFFMPLVEEFGWSRTAVSGAFSMSRIEGGLFGPVGGFLVDRFGPRKMMFLGITLMGAGYVLLSRIDSLVAFYLVFIFGVAAGSTLGIHQSAAVAVANWFIKRRGTAMGVGMSGIGLGGALVPLVALFIVQHGWRTTAFVMGLAIWVIGIPLALLMRHRPEQYGCLPDGETPGQAGAAGETVPSPTAERDISFTPRQALRTRVFWLLALVFGLRQLVVNAVIVHQIPFLTGIGISPQVAAMMLGSLAMLSVVGRLGFGRLADIMVKRYVMAACLGLMAVGCFILASTTTWWHMIPFLLIYSPAYGGGVTLMFALRGEYFGRRHFGTIMGMMDMVQMFGMVLGPVFAGFVFDVTGSYRLAFTIFGVTSVLAMLLVFAAKRPKLA